jgi:hypothetical protein
MYHVKEKGKGFAGMELIDGMAKVLQMVERCQSEKCISLVVVRRNNIPDAAMNTDYEDQVIISDIVDPMVFSVDDLGVLCPRQPTADVNDLVCLDTQQSQHVGHNNEIIAVEDGDCFLAQEGNSMLDDTEEFEFEGSMTEEEEEELISERGKFASEEYDAQFTEEKIGLSQKLQDLKKRRQGLDEHCEGDTDVEDIFCESDDSDNMVGVEPEPEPEPGYRKRKRLNQVKKGPTERTHFSAESSTPDCYVPSSDSGSHGDIKAEDDDAAELMSWVLPNGRKSRAKKRKLRIWYDEKRL